MYLTSKHFNEIEKAIAKEQHHRFEDRYFGFMDDTNDLEKVLQEDWFAVQKSENGVKAVIFDTYTDALEYTQLVSGYTIVGFEEFKRVTNDKWKIPDFYHPQKGSNWVVYVDYDLHY